MTRPMGIDVVSLALFLATVALGSYFQSVTGFGLSMIVMGLAGGLGVASVAQLAATISLMSVANAAFSLPGNLHRIDWRTIRATMLGSVPAIGAGVALLTWLSGSATALLQLLLGAFIMTGGLLLVCNPSRLARPSRAPGFLLAGFFSGFTNGLFGMGGPPLVFHFYRQPIDVRVVRDMLLMLFAITSSTRTVIVGVQGGLTATVWLLAALALPTVGLASTAARRWPPPLAPTTTRRLVFFILVGIGASLVITKLPGVLGR
ncbi:MAG: TSUP family transporter [Burkholderiaceae bacterium]|nr:TSUP family transporter [Burkholderiaceae bacterium]